MSAFMGKIGSFLTAFLKDRRGGIMYMFAFSLLPITAAAGLAVDSARLFLTKDGLQRSLDAAGLAAGHALELDQMIPDAEQFFDANFTAIDGIATLTDFQVDISEDNNVISLSATATVDTTFMRLFGHETVSVTQTTEITRETRGMELVLVMDNTGSMAGSKMTTMKAAAQDLVNIVYGDNELSPNLWVGLVPYAANVNMGANNASWLTLDDQTLVATGGYDPSTWKGCVSARAGGLDETDDTPDIAAFNAFLYVDEVDNDWILTDEDGDVTGFDIRDSHTDGNNARGPNLGCGPAITPLTAQKSTVQGAIAEMEAWSRGGTTSNLGLIWGWRAISPRWQGLWTEAAEATLPLPYDEPFMDKVVVILTDGQNQFFDFRGHEPDNGVGPAGSDFTAYGRLEEFGFATLGQARDEVDDRFARICTSMKNEGIVIYTITFGSTPNGSTQNLYRQCASKDSFYFHAPNNSQLSGVFETIGRQLSNLRLSR